MGTKERIMFWDILKGFGIISIVFGHCCPQGAPYVYTYHLALFFFVSAYFYNEKKYINKPFEYVGNLFKNNWPKYVFYMTLLILFHNIGVKFAFSHNIAPYNSFREMLNNIELSFIFICKERFGGAMWFVLPNMVAGCVLALSVCFAERFTKLVPIGKHREYEKNVVIIIVGAILTAFFSKTPMSFGIHNSFLMFPVCLGAYFMRKVFKSDFRKYLKPCIALFCGGFIYILVKFAGLRVELSAKIIPGYLWLYALSFMGIYLCMYLSKIVERIPVVSSFIAFLGKHSFAIMALHFVAIKLVDRIYCFAIGEKNPAVIAKWVCTYPQKLWWLYLIAGTVLPAIFPYLINILKSKATKRLEKTY